jgi:hypothetical protein
VDDVVRLGKTTVILIIDSVRRQCEAISEAILSRSHKMAILALGGWAERQEWPFEWLCAPDHLKTFGVTSPLFGLNNQPLRGGF